MTALFLNTEHVPIPVNFYFLIFHRGSRRSDPVPSRRCLSMKFFALVALAAPLVAAFKAGVPLLDPRALGVPVAGRLSLVNSTGARVGFVGRSTAVTYGIFTLTTNASDAASVKFTVPLRGSLFDVQTVGTDQPPETSLLGFVQGADSATADLYPATSNYLYLTGVARTLVGSPPVPGNSTEGTISTLPPANIESAVWAYEFVTRRLSPRWTNSNHTVATGATFAFVPSSDNLFLIADVAVFETKYKVPIIPLSLILV